MASKCDLSNIKPIGMGWYDCSICAVGTIAHTDHDGPYISLTAEQIDEWWAVRDQYDEPRDWYNEVSQRGEPLVSTYCGDYPDDNHAGCPSSVECYIPSMEAEVDAIRYMECKACGEVFEMTGPNPRKPVAAMGHQSPSGQCAAVGFRRDLTEDEAF